MSRIARYPISIPEKTEVTVEDGLVTVKGPAGELSRRFKSDILIAVEDGKVKCTPNSEKKQIGALWGTYASHVKNMILGVNTPFEKRLVVEGVGYRAEMQGNELVLNVGYSHPVKIAVPEGLKVSVDKNTISVSGIDKEEVGMFTARVRAYKKPEPYKGKGIRYEDETIRRKEGKKSA